MDIIIVNAFFLSLQFFRMNKLPNPAFTHNPARHAPKPIPPNKYNSLIIIEEEQLGINPIRIAKRGER